MRIWRRFPMLVVALALPLALAADPKTDGADGKRDPKNDKEDVEAIGDREVGGGMNFYSLEKEIGLGKRLAQDVERHAKIVDDPVIAEYVNRVGQNLVRNSDAKVPFTIKLIDSQEVNAFALPGGFFYVNAGLFMRAESEAELAGVMAHEIAHVAARHGTKQATKGQVMQLATIPLIFMGGGWTAYGIYQAAGFAIPVTFLSFSRSAETEADFLGVQYLYKSGYDPTAFVDFFEKMKADEKRKPGTMSKLFRSHPPHGKRIVKVQETIDGLLPNKPEYVVSTSEFLDVKSQLAASLTRGARKAEEEDPNKPTLRRPAGDPTIPAGDEGEEPETEEDDGRPTLKRR